VVSGGGAATSTEGRGGVAIVGATTKDCFDSTKSDVAASTPPYTQIDTPTLTSLRQMDDARPSSGIRPMTLSNKRGRRN
jgi:hypothetical protein